MDSATGDNISVSKCAECNKVSDSLKKCGGCNQVKYCNSICQRSHWSKHKKECRQLAVSSGNDSDNTSAENIGSMKLSDNELMTLCSIIEQMVIIYENENEKLSSISDDELFRDPPPREDCPICMLPMPHCSGACCGVRMTYQSCCGKLICEGCVMATVKEMIKGNLNDLCAFCRIPHYDSDKEALERYEKRMDMGDAAAFYQLGELYNKGGDLGIQGGDVKKAIELWSHAVELGSIDAHQQLGNAYFCEGDKKDVDKALYHYKVAAIGGHEPARHILGMIEEYNGNMDRAMKHYMIAARAGFDTSLKEVGEGYKTGLVTKDEYASILRAYQVSVDEVKSEQRAAATALHP